MVELLTCGMKMSEIENKLFDLYLNSIETAPKKTIGDWKYYEIPYTEDSNEDISDPETGTFHIYVNDTGFMPKIFGAYKSDTNDLIDEFLKLLDKVTVVGDPQSAILPVYILSNEKQVPDEIDFLDIVYETLKDSKVIEEKIDLLEVFTLFDEQEKQALFKYILQLFSDITAVEENENGIRNLWTYFPKSMLDHFNDKKLSVNEKTAEIILQNELLPAKELFNLVLTKGAKKLVLDKIKSSFAGFVDNIVNEILHNDTIENIELVATVNFNDGTSKILSKMDIE